MQTRVGNRIMVRGLDDAGVADSARLAAEALDIGRLVIAPTETVYGVFASARFPGALHQLVEAGGSDATPGSVDVPPHTWHAASVAAVERAVDLPTPVHRRLVRGLVPGPVRLVLEQRAPALDRLHETLEIRPGVFSIGAAGDEGSGWVSVRVPDHALASAVLSACESPIIADRLGRTRWRDHDRPDHRIDDRLGLDRAVFDGMILDAGTISTRPPSTTIRVRLNGAFDVSAGGAVSEERVMAALRRRILFVCTGNTCRSPMAEAIARMLLAERRAEDGTETVVASAGVMAGPGAPATPEAVDAARELGADLSRHRSQGLTRAMIDEAERVFVMTAGHGDRAESLVSGSSVSGSASSGKIQLLDPDGDIPDPIGGPPAVYRETAERIRVAIERRFEELGV